MYLLILASSAASYDKYTIKFSTDMAEFFKVWWARPLFVLLKLLGDGWENLCNGQHHSGHSN